MATLKVHHASMLLRKGNGETAEISEAVVQRSKLLRDMKCCADVDSETEHPLPVNEHAFALWLRQADRLLNDDTAGDFEEPPVVAEERVGSLCSLITASDVLIDEGTKMHAAALLGDVLSHLHAPDAVHTPDAVQAPDAVLSQVAASLSEHLLLAVLSYVPLPICLGRFPATYHRLSILAHNPSVETSSTLHLPALPPHAVGAALTFLTSTSTLVSVSLAGSSPHAASALFATTLRALRHLTALDLRDTALSHRPTATAVADALPALPLLATLDLSDNAITLPAMQALQTALRRCSALRALHMLRAFSPHAPDYVALGLLGGVLRALSGLTALSIGGRGGMVSEEERAALAEPITGLLRKGTLRLPALQSFELRLYEADLPDETVTEFCQFFQHLPPLRHLGLDVPLLVTPPLNFVGKPLHIFEEQPPREQVAAAYGHLSRSIAAQTQLTSLDLDICSLRHTLDPTTSPHEALRSLPGLLQLNLRFSATNKDRMDVQHDDLAAVAPVLSRLSHLSHLHITTLPRHQLESDLPRPESLRLVVDAVAGCMPHMRVLHLPVPAVASAGDGGLVSALLSMTQLQQLTVDLYFGGRHEREVRPWGPQPNNPLVSMHAPLFPHVRTLDVEFFDDDDWWLQPLGAAATVLTQLHALHIRGPETEAVVGEGLGAVLESIGTFTSLRELDVRASIRMLDVTADEASDQRASVSEDEEEDEEEAEEEEVLRKRFHDGLRRLTALTSLRMSSVPMSSRHLPRAEVFPPFVPHVSCLKSLRVLRMPSVAAVDAQACARALEPLGLKTLLVDRSPDVGLECVLDVVKSMHELRVFTVMSVVGTDAIRAIDAVLRELPSCRYEPFQEYMTQDEE